MSSNNNMNVKSLLDLYEARKKSLIWNPMDGMVYIDNPVVKLETVDERFYDGLQPVMDATKWNESARSKSASTNDAVALSDVFVDGFVDLANDMFTDIQKQQTAGGGSSRSKTAAPITSQDYSVLQQAVVIGETADTTKVGVLAQALPEINVPTLKGEYVDWTTGVDFFMNVPEGKSVEPTKGTAAVTEYTVPKHMGGVAITERAQAVINEANVFQRNISELQRIRLQKENALVATEIEASTLTQAGVDFGAREASGVPYSNTNPFPTLLIVQDLLDAAGGTWNAIMSKNIVFNEYINNDFVRGLWTAQNSPAANEMSGPVPGLPGVTWYRDNSITLATKLWAMDLTRAIKGLRSAVRSFQIENLKEENTEYYLKSYYLPKIVDTSLIYEVTGVQA